MSVSILTCCVQVFHEGQMMLAHRAWLSVMTTKLNTCTSDSIQMTSNVMTKNCRQELLRKTNSAFSY